MRYYRELSRYSPASAYAALLDELLGGNADRADQLLKAAMI